MPTMLDKNTADDILKCFHIFRRKLDLTSHAGDSLHEMSNPVFLGKEKEVYNQFIVYWIRPESDKS